MRKTVLKVQKWEKKIISGVCFTNKEYYGCFMYKHQNRFIFDFALMRSYFMYGCNVLRQVVNHNGKLMLVSDKNTYTNGIKITAIKASFFYGCGYWPGGILTKIKLYTLVPSFLVSLGMDYPRNFLNEACLLQIPTISYLFTVSNRRFFINGYIFPAITRESTLMLRLANIFAFFAKKYVYSKNYSKFIQIKYLHINITTGLQILKNTNAIFTKYTKGCAFIFDPSVHFLKNKTKKNIVFIFQEQLHYVGYYYKKILIKEKQKIIISHKKYVEQTEMHLKNVYINKKKLNLSKISSILIDKKSLLWAKTHKI